MLCQHLSFYVHEEGAEVPIIRPRDATIVKVDLNKILACLFLIL